MGACGCINNEIPIYRFPGPNELTYVINVYPSCSYCDTPAGVTIDLIGDEELKFLGLEHVEEVFQDRKRVDLGPGIPVIDKNVLKKAIIDAIPRHEALDDFGAEEVASETLEKFSDVVYETVREWQKQKKK